MTDFKPFKERIWESVRTDDRAAFDEACDALMEKASKDIWRIGWGFMPETIEDVFKMFAECGRWCHERWLEAMENGDAPPEDVSPGESFAMLSETVRKAIEKGELPPDEILDWWKKEEREKEEKKEKKKEDENLKSEEVLPISST